MKSRCTIPLLLIALAGCGTRGDILAPGTPAAGSAEEASLQGEMALHPELLDEEFSASADATTLDAAAGAGADATAAIDPLFYWREIRRVERAFEFAFSDTDSTGRPTRAVVTAHRFLHGSFHVVARPADGTGEPAEGRTVTKPLHDHWVRRLALVRVEGADGRRPWRIAGTSGVRITAREATVRIRSLRVQSGALDTTITDVLELFRLRRVLRFDPQAEVRLTVTTGAEDNVVVLHVRDRRMRLAPQGGGVYAGAFTAAEVAGLHHFGVNALSHGTLFDDAAPYDSQSWILPYVTPPGELAELAP